jgi:hypothetical protein
MQRVEFMAAMTALFAGYGASISTFASANRTSSSVRSSILSPLSVSILSLLLLTGPAVLLVSGAAGLKQIGTRETPGG